MCAIAGILGGTNLTRIRQVERMIAAQGHRGPDRSEMVEVAVNAERSLVLGHARLSIIDLSSSSNQPMRDSETQSWLAFNGEIYNYRELRHQLVTRGRKFNSAGDTEVLLQCLLEWGPQVLARVRGMYAFAFWDARVQSLVLGRDPFGIKPLLYCESGDAFVFASEMRGLEAAGISLTPDPDALSSFLTFGFTTEPATVMREAASLPPGHVLSVDRFGRHEGPKPVCTLESIWQRARVAPATSRLEMAESAHTLLQRSVSEQLVADVPVGVFLSGGIDSSLVAGLASRSDVTSELTYLTVAFPEAEFSELDAARQIAGLLRGRHEVVHLDRLRLLTLLPEALQAMDQPTVDGVNTFIVSRVAAEKGIKVVLSGLGGDELFAGYTTFLKAPLLARHPRLVAMLARWAPDRLIGANERQKAIHAPRQASLRDAYLLQRALRWNPGDRHQLAGLLPVDAPVSNTRWNHPIADRQGDVGIVSLLETTFYMRNQLLRDSDIFSAANSVELRVPFLDLELAELAWKAPASLHRKGLRGKRVLLDILRRVYPGRSFARPKMGFTLPWKHWLRDAQFQSLLYDTIGSASLYHGLPIMAREGRNLIDRFLLGDPDVTWAQVWSLFVLLSWIARDRSRQAAA